MADVNLHSFTGPEYNNQTVDWTDKLLIDGHGYSDTLKFTSQLTNFTGKFPNVRGGKEDCADVNNRSKNLRLSASSWQGDGRYCFTIKGGSEDIHVSGPVTTHAKSADVELGNWSDQSNDKTKRVTLALTSPDHSPITVRVLKAEKPILAPGTGPYKFLFPSPKLPVHGLIVGAYFFFLGLFKKLSKKGVR